MIFFVFLFILCFVIVAIFAFPQFSPIPYFPSNKKDLSLIIKALNLNNNQLVFDLGAGDGLVIFEASKEALRKKLNTQFIAVEINPVLLCILYIRRLFHPNKKNIRIMYGNMFSMDFFNYLGSRIYDLTFYLYISPWHLEKTVNNIRKQFNNVQIVSYMYPIKSLKKKEKKIKGFAHLIYSYTL